ncbi:MAG: histidine kinase [Pseudomonadota bacterium]
MHADSTPAIAPPPKSSGATTSFPFKRYAIGALYATVFNIGCAIVTYVIGRGTFIEHLFGSLAIGSVIYLILNGVRLALWRDPDGRRPKAWQIILLLALAVPAAQYGGNVIWSLLHASALPSLDILGSQRVINASVFTLFAAGVAMALLSYRERLAQAKAEAALARARSEAIERQALQAQLQLLQAQIEPHMLFNTLANLQGLIDLDPARAQTMLDQLIQYLRATLSSSRAASTTLAQEFALMQAYLGLMSVRMGARLSFTLTLPPELRGAAIAPMLLQPLIENAIQHGLEPKVEGGHIAVEARREGAQLTLCVADNGLGLNAPSCKAGTHLGLSNTRARLRSLYGEAATLSLEAGSAAGATALLTLPITPA